MIDDIVRRVLREKFRYGLFEKPYANDSKVALQNQSAMVQPAKELKGFGSVSLKYPGCNRNFELALWAAMD